MTIHNPELARQYAAVKARGYREADAVAVFRRQQRKAEQERRAAEIEREITRQRAEAERLALFRKVMPRWRAILNAAASVSGYTVDELAGHDRNAKLMRVRHAVAYLMRQDGGYSFPVAGQRLGGRDHSTMIHAFRKVDRLLAGGDATMRGLVEAIRAAVAA